MVASWLGCLTVLMLFTLAAGLVLLPIQDDPEVHRARAAAGWFPRRSRPAIVVYSVGVGFLGFGLGVAVRVVALY